ncbi:MAG: hypothetical protein JSR64_15740 [Nitrospira sp.]|nr:hypothetical protein [Nitrospira sp.]
MTPTDALIEKMAKAIAAAAVLGKDPLPFDQLEPVVQKVLREYARAAYSAEHEEDGK